MRIIVANIPLHVSKKQYRNTILSTPYPLLHLRNLMFAAYNVANSFNSFLLPSFREYCLQLHDSTNEPSESK